MRNLLFVLLLFLFASCWPTSLSFRDGSIPSSWERFVVNKLENNAANAPTSYPSELTEQLKDAIQSRLGLTLVMDEGDNPEIIVSGTINSYDITPLSLQDDNAEVMNRLTIRVSFNIFVAKPEEDEMVLNVGRFADFNASQDIGSIESELLEDINEQIIQDVLNKLLSNW